MLFKSRNGINLENVSVWQGPAGKDGLPGHPGQRGEPVSINLI